jgi:DNA-binding CsgD family transcriptional regulator
MIANGENRPPLPGRRDECETLARLVDGVRRGQGAVLVVHGAPGTGKTALLDHAAEQAAGLRVIRVAGTESEADLAYAGLWQLCGPLSDLLGRLPDPQRCALEIAFGVRAGAGPDRFLVGLGVSGLLTEAAAQSPLVCLIDAAHRLDRPSEQALAFAARRLGTRSVLVIFAARQLGTDLAGLPEMPLAGLPDDDARELLAALVRWPLDERLRDQVVAETRGNPRALTQLALALAPGQLAGGFGLADVRRDGLPADLLRQVGALPGPTRLLLLIAAADQTGDPALVLRAAGHLAIPAEAAYPAVEDDLLTFGTRVVFQRPEVRSAAYWSGSPGDRRAAHGALAVATGRRDDQDRRAWHRAAATAVPDEDVAAELERTAAQAQARGGHPASAAFLERAAALTPDPHQRAGRALAAATALLQAGQPDTVLGLLDLVAGGSPDDSGQAGADLVRARLAFAKHRSGDAPRLLLAAARRLERCDAAQASTAYLDAIRAVTFAGGLAAAGGTVSDVARAARSARAAGLPRPVSVLLEGLATFLSGARPAAAPILRRALSAWGEDMTAAQELRWLPLACGGALLLWDDQAWHRLSTRSVQLARDAGALGDLPLALGSLACLRVLNGELAAAASLTAQAQAIAETAGSAPSPYGGLALAAVGGDQGPALGLIDSVVDDAALRGEGLAAAAAQWAAAMLHNSLGQYATALSAAEDVAGYAGQAPVAGWAAAELIEAAVRAGQPDRAAGAMSRLSEDASVAGTSWALGIRARSLALLSDGAAAEERYQAAIGFLSKARVRVEEARAYLLYGEWLRRQNRRVDAREQLHRAHDMLSAIGAAGFAERARRELLATGQTVRKRTPEADRDLTAQEMQIAGRARDGQTNPEIGAELFLSPRTVEWHLRKVFAKLGITSRRQLQYALRDVRDAVAP